MVYLAGIVAVFGRWRRPRVDRPPAWTSSRRRTSIGVLALSLGASWTTTVSVGQTLESSNSPAGLDAYLRAEMAGRRIPGMQVAVVRHAKIVLLRSYGLAEVEHNVPVTNHTVFLINSCTKAFTGVALLQLVETGKLDLSAPVSRYLDSLPQSWRGVTVRQLANHTSGLPDIIDPGSGRLIVANGDAQAAWQKVQTLPLEFSPGDRESYNQTNYLLLGMIIDKLSAEPFAQFITHRQFDIVGMPRTAQSGFTDNRDIVPDSVRSYTNIASINGQWVQTDKMYFSYFERPPFLRAGMGIDSTAEEIARWLIALQGERLLTKNSLAALWTPSRLNNGTTGLWGIGWPILSRKNHRAFAATGGLRSAFWVYPEDDLAVVVLTNLSGSRPEQFIDGIAAHYIPDMRQDLAAGK